MTDLRAIQLSWSRRDFLRSSAAVAAGAYAMRWGLAAAADIPLEFASSITARYPGAGSHSSATAPIVVDGFADSPLERHGFELPVPGFSRAFFAPIRSVEQQGAREPQPGFDDRQTAGLPRARPGRPRQ